MLRVNKGYVFLFICTGLFLRILYISLCYKCMWIFWVAARNEQNALTSPPSRGFTREWRHLFYSLFSLCFRLRVIPLSLSPSCVTRKKTASRPQESRGHFFSRGFLSRHAGRTKRKRYYSQPTCVYKYALFLSLIYQLGWFFAWIISCWGTASIASFI